MPLFPGVPMKLLIFLTLVACSAPETKQAPVAPEKSPYTVAECMCMKIYRPVCGSNGQTYGNSCEAECNKVVKWTEGACK
jgi:hypothetical protein